MLDCKTKGQRPYERLGDRGYEALPSPDCLSRAMRRRQAPAVSPAPATERTERDWFQSGATGRPSIVPAIAAT